MKRYEDYHLGPQPNWAWPAKIEEVLHDILAELDRLDKLNLRFVDMLHEHTERLDEIEARLAKLEEGRKP